MRRRGAYRPHAAHARILTQRCWVSQGEAPERRRAILTIDTHCHASPVWLEPVEVLQSQMDRNGTDKAVLVQIHGQWDNRYLLEWAQRFPQRFSVVGRLDVNLPDAPDTLARWAAQGMRGVRLNVTDRSAGDDPLAIWRRADELKLVVSCRGSYEGYASEEFLTVIGAFPRLPMIVEHLGFVGTAKPPYTGYDRILALSRYPNVYMKVPGFGELSERGGVPRTTPFDLDAVPPFLDMAIRAFGADRLMLGTDFPLCSGREGYGNVVRYLREYLSRYGSAVQEAVMGKTAASLFTFGGQ